MGTGIITIFPLPVQSGDIEDGAITNAKIAALTIETGRIADEAITNAKIAALTIETGRIAANAIGESKIKANAVTETKIADDAVTADKIAALTALEMTGDYATLVMGTGYGYGKDATQNMLEITANGNTSLGVDADGLVIRGSGYGNPIYLRSDGNGMPTLTPKATYPFQLITSGSKVAAASGNAGGLFYEAGGGGSRDRLYMCLKSDSDTYSWVEIANGGA